MIHDARIIHLDGRPHLPPEHQAVDGRFGRSLGRRNTLVVDTTNFNDGGGFYGDAGGNFGWDRNLHLVERFSLLDADTLLYRFEIDDPTAFTQPWKGELTDGALAGADLRIRLPRRQLLADEPAQGLPRASERQSRAMSGAGRENRRVPSRATSGSNRVPKRDTYPGRASRLAKPPTDSPAAAVTRTPSNWSRHC